MRTYTVVLSIICAMKKKTYLEWILLFREILCRFESISFDGGAQ